MRPNGKPARELVRDRFRPRLHRGAGDAVDAGPEIGPASASLPGEGPGWQKLGDLTERVVARLAAGGLADRRDGRLLRQPRLAGYAKPDFPQMELEARQRGLDKTLPRQANDGMRHRSRTDGSGRTLPRLELDKPPSVGHRVGFLRLPRLTPSSPALVDPACPRAVLSTPRSQTEYVITPPTGSLRPVEGPRVGKVVRLVRAARSPL